MHISGLTGSQVWLSSSRSLTNFGSGALTSTSIVNTSIAGAATVDLRTSPGIVSQITIAVLTGAAAASSIQVIQNDGTNQIQLAATAAAASSSTSFSMANTNSVGMQLKNNDATHAGNYIASAYSMTI